MNPGLGRIRGVNEALVERIPVAAADTETFAALYERTFPRVYAYGKLLAGFAGVTIRVLALALPLGAIALLGWLAGRSLRRRRRESALA
jgi:hypothetical protein